MSDGTTKRMLAPFVENAPTPMFLSSFFLSEKPTYHNSGTVEIDVQRDGEDVAIVITGGPGNGQNENENSVYSNKEIEPPTFDEVMTVNAQKLLKRMPGENPFDDPDYQAAAILQVMGGMVKLQGKIRRAVELMASQVLQTGKLEILNKQGAVAYTLDFQRKDALYAAAAATWHADGNTTGDPLEDIRARAELIRTHGRRSPDTLIFGVTAWERFLLNNKVKERLSLDGLGLGQLAPEEVEDATFQGIITIGHYKYKMWTYDGRYNHPQTGVSTPYVGNENVLILASKARRKLSFGRIPIVMPEKGRVLDTLPPRIMDSKVGIDLTTHSWLVDGGKALKASAGTRPLTMPVEIDAHGCIDVTV